MNIRAAPTVSYILALDSRRLFTIVSRPSFIPQRTKVQLQ